MQYTEPIQENPTYSPNDAVADSAAGLYGYPQINAGAYYTGLTQDDVGGLCYLLSTNNIVFENLLADVSSCGPNTIVDGAFRPGIDKITFVPHATDSNTGAFLSMTNLYTDTFVSNGVANHQPVKRVTTQPDFIFSLKNQIDASGAKFLYTRTGTTNWIKNSATNGSLEGGPGVIRPQVKIVYNSPGHLSYYVQNSPNSDSPVFWASYDGSTNAPILYPVASLESNQFLIRMLLIVGQAPNQPQMQPKIFEWSANNAIGSTALFQSSTNLTSWDTMFTATNDGRSWDLENINPIGQQGFYRVVPQ